MAQKILKVGSSAAVTIPKQLLNKLGLTVGDRVELSSDSKSDAVVVRPVKKDNRRRERVAKLTLSFIDRYRKDLEKLAEQ